GFRYQNVEALSLSLYRFSHPVCFREEDGRRYLIHPVVEVVDRYATSTRVAHLDKLEGFVSLFQRRSHVKNDSVLIEDSQLYRFAHKVASFKMSSNHEKGAPEGSFELDPQSLPAVTPFELHC
ncbi:hypothetical protein ACH5RR_016541, partial [Cinchona calisaya]